jgi:hypothetical protein
MMKVEGKMESSATWFFEKHKQGDKPESVRRSAFQAVQISLMAAGLILVGGYAADLGGAAVKVLSATGGRAEEVASDVDTSIVSDRLTPRMKAALQNVAYRYHVAPVALVPVFEAIQAIAVERHLDPMLLVAVISIESRFNPYSQSVVGAQGLMQVMPRYHQDKVPDGSGPMALLDPIINVQVGAQILQESIRSQGGLVAGLQQFGGAIHDEDRVYSAKVLAEKQRLEQATRRSA